MYKHLNVHLFKPTFKIILNTFLNKNILPQSNLYFFLKGILIFTIGTNMYHKGKPILCRVSVSLTFVGIILN